MNKAELIAAVRNKVSFESEAAATRTVNAVLDSMKEGVIKDGELALVGFGTMSVVDRAAREGRNPQTGKAVQIPAKKAIKFKAGKAFVEAVN